MREKLYKIINNIYGILMFIAFFGGFVPVIPFVVALIIGGTTGQAISLFLYKSFYPWVIAIASIAVIVGLIGMYIGKLEGLSVKNINVKDENKKA